MRNSTIKYGESGKVFFLLFLLGVISKLTADILEEFAMKLLGNMKRFVMVLMCTALEASQRTVTAESSAALSPMHTEILKRQILLR